MKARSPFHSLSSVFFFFLSIFSSVEYRALSVLFYFFFSIASHSLLYFFFSGATTCWTHASSARGARVLSFRACFERDSLELRSYPYNQIRIMPAMGKQCASRLFDSACYFFFPFFPFPFPFSFFFFFPFFFGWKAPIRTCWTRLLRTYPIEARITRSGRLFDIVCVDIGWQTGHCHRNGGVRIKCVSSPAEAIKPFFFIQLPLNIRKKYSTCAFRKAQLCICRMVF